MNIRLFFSALMLCISTFAFSQASTQNKQLDSMKAAIESMAYNNGVDLNVTYTVQEPMLNILAEMTDDDDSIDYITGFLNHSTVLQMFAHIMAPALATLPEVTELNVTVTDRNDQRVDLTFIASEIIQAAEE